MNSILHKRSVRRDELKVSAEDKGLRDKAHLYLLLVVLSPSITNVSKFTRNEELRLGQRQDIYSWDVVA